MNWQACAHRFGSWVRDTPQSVHNLRVGGGGSPMEWGTLTLIGSDYWGRPGKCQLELTSVSIVEDIMGLWVLFAALALWTPDLDWATLESAYLKDRRDLRHVDGVRWHVRDEGQPRDGTLVLIHGFASALHTWNVWAEALHPRYRVVRMDLPGFALSGPVAGGDYGVQSQCQRLDALLRHLKVGPSSSEDAPDGSGVKPVVWVGHSMGADLAARCASQSARPPHALVLVAPAQVVRDRPLTAAANPKRNDGAEARWMAWVAWALPRQWVEQGLRMAHATEHPPSEAEVDRSFAMLRAPGVRSAIIQMSAQRPVNEAERDGGRPAFQGPVWVAVGDQERLLNYGSLTGLESRVKRRWPQAQLQVYRQAGHMVHEDAAEALMADVRAFVAQRVLQPERLN